MIDHVTSGTPTRSDPDGLAISEPAHAPARGKRSRLGVAGARKKLSTSTDSTKGADEALGKALGQAGPPWVMALRKMLGVPAPGQKGVHFAWGFRNERLASADLRILAQRLGRHVIFLEFEENGLDRPPSIIMAVLGKATVILHENCELWVLKARHNVEILTAKRRFKVDDAGYLKSRGNNLDEMRARRVTLTHARWSTLAAEMAAQGPFEARIIPQELFAPIGDEADVR